MAKDMFKRYSTVSQLLHQLNKQQQKLFQESFNVENLVQSVNYFDKIKSLISSETYMQTTPAFVWDGNIITQNGNIITLDTPQPYLHPPCLIFYNQSVDIINKGNGIYTINSDIVIYAYQDKYFTRISDNTYLSNLDIPTGQYTFIVFMRILERVGNNFTTDIIQPLTLPQEANIYGNQLTP